MKKTIYLLLALLTFSIIGFSQGNGNKWYLPPSTLPTLTSDGMSFINTQVKIDYAGGCCGTCGSSYTARPTPRRFMLKFVRTAGTVLYPSIYVNGVGVNFAPDGNIGYAKVDLYPTFSSATCPSGYWTGSSPFSIQAVGGFTATYAVTVDRVADNEFNMVSYPEVGWLSHALTTSTEILNIVPPPPACASKIFTISTNKTALVGMGDYATLTITTTGNLPNTGTATVTKTKYSGPSSNYGSVSLSYISGTIDCSTGAKLLTYQVTKTSYPVGGCVIWRISLDGVTNNSVGSPNYVDIMSCPSGY